MTAARFDRIAEVIGAVARQALADRGARRIALLDDGAPEADLAATILSRALGGDAVVRVTAGDAEVESVLHLAADVGPDALGREIRLLKARLVPGALAADPANKTALLLGAIPPVPLLPLGDLWASDVEELTGGWSAPAPVLAIAELAGGVAALDDALRSVVDRREPRGLDALPSAAADAVRSALDAGRGARMHPPIVPKIGYRTLGVDLFD